MLGGGIFVTQDKVLPGAYINIINATTVSSTLGLRGVVAIPLSLNKSAGTVIQAERKAFYSQSQDLFGKPVDDPAMAPLRELFRNATKVYVYDLGVDKTPAEAIAALQAYDFNILCAYTDEQEAATAYIKGVKTWRDQLGKKCQVVVFNQTTPDHEGVINLVSKPVGSQITHALTAWVAGAEAACAVNRSITNMKYDGEYVVSCTETQKELEAYLNAGKFAFNNVYGDICVLQDINSLTTFTSAKGVDFKYNQTIRVVDQIANDIAKLFNTKYLGKIQNNDAGRTSLWADIVAHHKRMEDIGAIENFNPQVVIVERGQTKKSVVVHDEVTPVNAMAQLYMTVVIN